MARSEQMDFSHSSVDDDTVIGPNVPAQYRGTAFDKHDMSVLGKKQVLRRPFGFSTMLGFASTVMVAWEFVLLLIPWSLQNGGTAGVFWGLFVCPFVMLPVYASLAEVASTWVPSMSWPL